MRKRFWMGAILSIVLLYGWSAMSQPPQDGKGGGQGGPPLGQDFGGPPPPPPRPWQPGKIMPPHVQDELELTSDQQKQLAALEAEVKEKILAILTSAQKEKLPTIRDRRPPGPPPGPPGDGPDDQGPPPRHRGEGPPR